MLRAMENDIFIVNGEEIDGLTLSRTVNRGMKEIYDFTIMGSYQYALKLIEELKPFMQAERKEL